MEVGLPFAMANPCAQDNTFNPDECFKALEFDRADGATKDVDTTLISVLNTVIALVSLIYVPFSMLSSWLLSPDWTFGDFIHLRPVLHSLWVFVSNTVYVVFAAMLIIVAIANIFGQSDSYAIKKMLPRFIIGVIMVPFTWWVVSASLSVSSYLTALTLRMPADIIQSQSDTKDLKINAPAKCFLDFTNNGNSNKIWYCNPSTEIPFSEYLLRSNGAYGIIPLYAYNIFKFNNLDEFKNVLNSETTRTAAYNGMSADEQRQFDTATADAKSAMLQAAIIATGIGKIGVQLLMSALFAIVFTVILIALVLVLFVRVIKMWMYAIFSPLFALRYFLSDKIDKDNAIAKFDFKEFIGLAMVPVVVSAALGFGFMFIMTFKTKMDQPIDTATQKGIQSDYVTVTNGGTNTGSIQFFGTTIEIKLSAENAKSANGVAANDFKAALFNVLSGLITPIFGIVILWMAVMAAIKTSKVAGEAIKGIEEVGGMAKDAAKKLPGMISIPGSSKFGKDGKNINFRQAAMMPKITQNWMGAKEAKEQEAMKSWMGIGDGIKSAVAEMKNASTEQVMKIYTSTTEGTNISAIAKNSTHRANLQELATRAGTWADEDKEKFDSGDLATVKKVMSDAFRKIASNPTLYGMNSSQADFLREMATTGRYGEDEFKKLATTIKNLKIVTNLDFHVGGKKLTFNDDGTAQEITIGNITGVNNDSSESDIKAAILKSLEGRGVTVDQSSITDQIVRDVKRALSPPTPPPGAGSGGTP